LSGDAPAGVEFRAATTPARVQDILPVLDQVWGGDHRWKADELSAMLGDNERALDIVIAYADGRPVASSWIEYYDARPFATLWGGSTLPDYRGRGIYRHLVRLRAALASKRGVRFLTVDAGDESRPILERLGFKILGMTTPYIWTRRPAS
jgi:GNAT superfamily N-acetyltransferase